MSLETAIIENTAAIRQLIAQLAGQALPAPLAALAIEVGAEPAPVATPPKAKRARPAAQEPVQAPAQEPEPLPTQPATVAVTYDDIKAPFLSQLIAKHGRAAGAQLLRDFGVAEGGKLSDIPADKWPAVLEAIQVRSA